MGFVMTLLQIAMEESFVGVIIRGLRAAAVNAGQPADKAHKSET